RAHMSTLIRTEKRQRSPLGQLIKWVFIAFNVFMLLWLVSGMHAVSQMTPHTDAGRVGHAIGAAVGFSMIISLWVSGALILGLFVLLTRGDTVIVEERAAGEGGRASALDQTEESDIDADAVIARYIQRQQAEAKKAPLVSPATAAPASFGRRRR